MVKTMITTNQNFHTSINIAFDLSDEFKIRSFIPTTSACLLIESLFMAVAPGSTNRAKVLVGAYGRGKSHIVMMTLALLSKKDPELFSTFLSDISNVLPEFATYVKEYTSDNRKLLPVVITGNTANLSQSFLQALQTALRVVGLEDLMPSTNAQGAIAVINVWKRDYPETFKRFEDLISAPPEEFITLLRCFNMTTYQEFLELYPKLTSGGVFNSLTGLDVLDVYDQTIAKLKDNGYDGVYVVYDEFSKYLETNIVEATASDVKLLQDFAEKCNRSGNSQMHLLLICHKDIANYIDGKLPKERVDGWRGVSGRFEHIEIRNGFAQSYELVESSILKDETLWEAFSAKYEKSFTTMEKMVVSSNLIDKNTAALVVKGCYPLHPTTTFLLPRISEKVAQNERTLFTYLASNEKNSLSQTYIKICDGSFAFITPDNLYDYFEPLFRKESYTSEIHSLYQLTTRILARLDEGTLEAKIVKTLMLVYTVAQFECLAPTIDQIINTYASSFTSTKEIESAIERLIREDAVVYLRKSNGYLKLKESSGVDIEDEIDGYLERNGTQFTVADVLNEITSGKAVYPSQHNDKNEIVRYFQCNYLSSDNYWDIEEIGMTKESGVDGYLMAVLPYDRDDLFEIKETISKVSERHPETVFILPSKYREINEISRRQKAALSLHEEARDDTLLADEYEVLIEDYSEVISSFNASYFQPELKSADYYQNGKRQKVHRKAQLSALLSKICDEAYPKTPLINNEAINKNQLSPAAVHSRTKILTGLCTPILEPNLGLQGNGQECSIMRSVFSVTGIIGDLENAPSINLCPANKNVSYVFEVIREFIYTCGENSTLLDLYQILTTPAKGIGLKRGLVVLFIATVLREDWNNLLLMKDRDEQRLTAGVFNDIDCFPERYNITPIEWTREKADFVNDVKSLFSDYLGSSSQGDFTQAVDAISRWYLSLPRFTKTATKIFSGSFHAESYTSLPPEYLGLFKALKHPDINPRGFLFEELPQLFGYAQVNEKLITNLRGVKNTADTYISITTERLSDDLRVFFDPKAHPDASLSSIIKEWCESFSTELRERVFSGSTNRIINSLETFTGDETFSMKRLFKAVTSLRIEDWDERTIQAFINEMKKLKVDLENYSNELEDDIDSAPLKISYINDFGEVETKTFQTVACSQRAKLLKSEIENALDEMGQSIDDSEKRQVLFDALKGLC